jgi:hypothetical protein
MNTIGFVGSFYYGRLVHRKEKSMRRVVLLDQPFVPWLSKMERRIRPLLVSPWWASQKKDGNLSVK